MEQARRELLVARVTSGCVRVEVPSRRGSPFLLIRTPTRQQRYLAQEVYEDEFREAELGGVYTEAELVAFLLSEKLWSEEDQKLLDELPKQIDDMKVGLFNALLRSSDRVVTRKALGVAKDALAELHGRRHAYDHLSCAGVAAASRMKFLVGCGLSRTDGRPFYRGESFWERPDGTLDHAAEAYVRSRLTEAELREMARTEPWRSTWACRKAESSVFGVPAADYSEEQAGLVTLSLVYDSVYEHPECPADDVISDDDMLDGWLIYQRREREKRQAKKAGEELVTNEKIRNSQEIFLVAQTQQDAQKVFALNDDVVRAQQKRKLDFLKTQKGEVNEADMPDTRLQLQMAANRAATGG